MERDEEVFDDRGQFEIVNRESSTQQDPLINFDEIAQLLIQEKFVLTALEFYTELLENGLDLPRLRDYFSNPGNFERNADVKAEPSCNLPRTSSIQTFDSLDFTRYSDDGDRQTTDKLAVLEFELRKAKEMIKSLRANLTEAAESESTSDNYQDFVIEDDSIKSHESRALNYLVNEYLLKYNYKLTSITFSDENSNQDFEDWDDVGLNIPKPPSLLSLYREFGRNSKSFYGQVEAEVQVQAQLIDQSTMVEEQFFVDVEPVDAILPLEEKIVEAPDSKSIEANGNSHYNLSNLEENLIEKKSLIPAEKETANVSSSEVSSKVINPVENALTDIRPFYRILKELIAKYNASLNNQSANELCEVVNSNEQVILLLAKCLPQIVPNVILSKREELLPVILSTVNLHPVVSERDKLLNLLFNLIKRPDDDQRQIILNGFVAIAQLMGTTRVENELLPQCWEQIGHKYPERRILVAEACGVLIPHITTEMKSSLVLSMFQQMVNEEKIDVVRNAIVQSLAMLYAYMDDWPKYSLGMSLLLTFLHDPSEKVSKSALRLLLPSFCLWSKKLGNLESTFVPEILRQINDAIDKSTAALVDDGHYLIHLVEALLTIVPWIFILTIENVPLDLDINLSPYETDLDRLPPFVSPLCNLNVIVGDDLKCNSMINAFEACISQDWFEPWNSLDWVVKSFVADIFGLIKKDRIFSKEQTHSLCQLFYWFNRMFGRTFVIAYIKPIFKSIFKFRDQDKEAIPNQIAAIQIMVPVYSCGVLSVFNVEEDRMELKQFLREVLITISLSRLPLTGLEYVMTDLSSSNEFHDLILSMLWDGAVHSSSLVRSTSAVLFKFMIEKVDEHILATKIAPALMALANDIEIAVKISTVQSLGCILEKSTNKNLLSKAEAQLQTFLDDPIYKDQYELRIEIIRTLGLIAPISDSRSSINYCQSGVALSTFKEVHYIVLPHLVALANCNNQLHHEVKRTEIALAILDTFLVMSGFCTNEKVIQELVIPGLRCVLHDIHELAPVHEEIVISLINEFSSKISATSSPDRYSSSAVTSAVTSGVDEVRNRVGKIFTNRSIGRPNIQNIFSSRK